MNFNQYLAQNKALIAMIHLPALPGTPKSNLSPSQIIKSAVHEAKIYQKAGIKALMIENMHDVPYLNTQAGHEIASLMAIVGHEIKKQTGMYCGIQILAGANKAAMAAAYTSGMDFIRAEGFVFGHLADEGYIDSSAAELLRYRKAIGAENVLVFTDIKKKHSSHAITSDVSLAETAKAAEFFLSDGVILTGKSTAEEANITELKAVSASVKLPILIGSGITNSNISDYYYLADGFIVGSYLKKDGNWQNPPDTERISKLLKAITKLKN
jgi:membrane complex biogenesis BtpA family protein